MDIFSARLKWLREKNNYTQKEMAEKLGLSQQYYGRFEKNKGQPNLETLAKLPSILGESVDFMLGITDFLKHHQKLEESISYSLSLADAYSLKVADYLSGESLPTSGKAVVDAMSFLEKKISSFRNDAEEEISSILSDLNEIPFVSESTITRINKLRNK